MCMRLCPSLAGRRCRAHHGLSLSQRPYHFFLVIRFPSLVLFRRTSLDRSCIGQYSPHSRFPAAAVPYSLSLSIPIPSFTFLLDIALSFADIGLEGSCPVSVLIVMFDPSSLVLILALLLPHSTRKHSVDVVSARTYTVQHGHRQHT